MQQVWVCHQWPCIALIAHLPSFTPCRSPELQSHVFLFLIALIQILYACVSMLICLWKVNLDGAGLIEAVWSHVLHRPSLLLAAQASSRHHASLHAKQAH